MLDTAAEPGDTTTVSEWTTTALMRVARPVALVAPRRDAASRVHAVPSHEIGEEAYQRASGTCANRRSQ
jgi:hypothetical protein